MGFAGLISHTLSLDQDAERSNLTDQSMASHDALNKMKQRFAALDNEKQANRSVVMGVLRFSERRCEWS